MTSEVKTTTAKKVVATSEAKPRQRNKSTAEYSEFVATYFASSTSGVVKMADRCTDAVTRGKNLTVKHATSANIIARDKILAGTYVMSANITERDENLVGTHAMSADIMACDKILASTHATLARLVASSIELVVSSLKTTRDHATMSARLPMNSRNLQKNTPMPREIGKMQEKLKRGLFPP